MSPRPKIEADDDEMLPEYDFTGAVRGKYYDRYREGTNVILLDPDVAEVFRDARAVNDALRLLVSVARANVTRPPATAGNQAQLNKPRLPSRRRKRPGRQRRISNAARA